MIVLESWTVSCLSTSLQYIIIINKQLGTENYDVVRCPDLMVWRSSVIGHRLFESGYLFIINELFLFWHQQYQRPSLNAFIPVIYTYFQQTFDIPNKSSIGELAMQVWKPSSLKRSTSFKQLFRNPSFHPPFNAYLSPRL